MEDGYEDDRKGERITWPNDADSAGCVFVWSFCSHATVDCENDDRQYSTIEEMASPQFMRITQRADERALDLIKAEILSEEGDFWELDYDWSEAAIEWKFFGWEKPENGRTNLIGVLRVKELETGTTIEHGMVIGQMVPIKAC